MKIRDKRSLSYYLEQIECNTSDYGTYAFRGQENMNWPLESSATRRLRKYYYNKDLDAIPNFQINYIDYHKDILLNPARLNGFGIEKGRDLSDLEILAKLQHFGAATGLLDFTKNRVIALWFACQDDKYDGKVFIINTGSLKHFENITYEKTKEKITEIFLPMRTVPFIWEPAALGEPMVRIIRQHSLFVIETSPPIDSDAIKVVTIVREDKKELLQEIKKKFDIDKNSIFKDFYGFATVNKSTSDIPLFRSPTNYFELGNIAYQQKKHNEAIRYYSRAIDLKSDFLEAYYNRGNSYAAGGDYEKAMDDYDVVIDYIENKDGWKNMSWWASLCMLYFNKANCYAACENHRKAIENYNLYIKTFRFPNLATVSPWVYFNQGNSFYCLGDYHDAIKAYEKCIEIDKKYTAAWYNKGNAEVLLFQFDEAKKSYTVALEVNPSDEYAKSNLNIVESIIQNPREKRNYPFAGSKGNKGMFCGINKLSNKLGGIHTIDLYGANDGFEGYKGFKLLHLNGKWKRVLTG